MKWILDLTSFILLFFREFYGIMRKCNIFNCIHVFVVASFFCFYLISRNLSMIPWGCECVCACVLMSHTHGESKWTKESGCNSYTRISVFARVNVLDFASLSNLLWPHAIGCEWERESEHIWRLLSFNRQQNKHPTPQIYRAESNENNN